MSASGRTFIANALFRQRALAEAARYGSDPWVFVRELLQNSRDAGARHVELTVSDEGSKQRITCRDDGCGMTFEHARQYLFALYASSKEDRRAQAGKFGIGFWSVLRFQPATIVIRSRVGSQPAWEVNLDGDLEWAEVADCELGDGTEIVLERSGDGGGLGEQIYRTARRYGRFLTRRDRPGEALRVTVDSRRVNADFTLPAPCATFSGRGFRGVVGLGPKPRVELFAHGLFVRSADSLRDLQELGEPGRRSGAEDALAELPSLAPRVLLDGTELDLLLARGDARQGNCLRRMLRAAERALDRLVSRQLQALRPQPWYRSWWGAMRDRLAPWIEGARDRTGWPKTAAAAAAVVAMFAAGAVLAALFSEPPTARSSGPIAAASGPATPELEPLAASEAAGGAITGSATPTPGEGGAAEAGLAAEFGPGFPTPAIHAYSDLARRYHGPHPGRLGGDRSAVALTYRPASQPVLFNALVIDDLVGHRWNAPPVDHDQPAYRGSRCRGDCLEVELRISADGLLRLPIPTGHRLDPSSVVVDGRAAPVFETAHGEAVLELDGSTRGLVGYRTGPAPLPELPAATAGGTRSYPTPRRLAAAAGRLRDLPMRERVVEGLRFVAENVVYDRSPEAARAYLDDGSRSFAETALEIGAGDCDVQNGLLVELLRLAGVEARLALGYVGLGGSVSPGLHAWVEYLDDGRWHAADASAVAGGGAADDRRPSDANRRLPAEVLAGIAPPPATLLSRPWTAAALLLLTAGLVGLAVRRRNAAACLELDPAGDLAALLGGALRHPGAFSALPAMAHGRFVPLLGRADMISIDRARRLAAKRRLFRSGAASPLARDAAARGTPVIDGSTAEGRVLSLALGAIDLDHWSDLRDRASESGLVRWMNLELELLDETWRVRSVSGLGEPMTELALEDLGLGRRWVLIDPDHAEFAPARRFLPAHPGTAAFTALDLVVHRLDLSGRDRSRILVTSSRRALREVLR